jgi:hypothetical protein
LKAKIDELETNGVIKKIGVLYWGINDVKKGYKSRRNIVRDEKSDFVTDFHSILDRWRNRFSQLFNAIVSVILGRHKYTQQNY